jgi:DNA modification methylase
LKTKSINTVYNQDARKILETIPEGIKIATTITSPPYFDMKDYMSDNQVGYGQTYADYLNDLQKIFEGVFQITNDDGSLWIIIDTFKRDNQVVSLPFDLVAKLKESGWLLQDIIIWKKDKTVPWSSNGFVQRKFEYILFLTKSTKFKYNHDSVRVYDTDHLKKWWVKYPERYNPKGKALDEVWEFAIPTQGSWGDKYIRHFCPLPKDMVATMIQVSTNENDIILDPFAGSGTVLSQSAYMKREYVGFELNTEYIEMFKKYLEGTFSKYRKEYELSKINNQDVFEKQILELRSLKFARLLLNTIEKETGLKELKIFVSYKGSSDIKNKLIEVEYQIIGNYDDFNLLEFINAQIKKSPLSKFGIQAEFKFLDVMNFDPSTHYGYTKSNTYSFIKNIDFNSDKVKVISEIYVDLNEKDYI